MVTPVYRPSVSDPVAKGKEPESNPLKKRIEERRFSAETSFVPFKYLLERVKDRSEKANQVITVDDYSVTWNAKPRSFSLLQPRTFILDDFPKFLDATLAPGGLLFVAKEFKLGVYDLSSSSPGVSALYHLDYRFDRVTWEPKRMSLIGEKKGVVTELRFNSSFAKVQPLANPYNHFGEKVAYIAKRAFQIIAVESFANAYKITTRSMKYVVFSKEAIIISLAFGVVAGSTLVVVALSERVAIPILLTLGFVLGMMGFYFVLFSSISILEGVVISAQKTFQSLKELHREEIFS